MSGMGQGTAGVAMPAAAMQSGPGSQAAAAAPAPGMAATVGPAPPSADEGFTGALSQMHDRQTAQYDKLREASKQLSAVRGALDELVKLGDLVTSEDVVKGASRLVAAGMSASAVAGLLAEMPPDGAPLQGWLVQHDQVVRQNEAQVAMHTALARHALGTSALRMVAGHSAVQGAAASQLPAQPPPDATQPQAQSSALAPQGA